MPAARAKRRSGWPPGRKTRGLVPLLIIVVLATTSVGAADVVPEAAYTAPLANRSLLLDANRVGESVIAVGAYGHILRIGIDGSWQQMPSPVRTQLTAVHFVDENRGWAVGHDAAILRTEDGGRTWSLQHHAPELQQPLFDVLFLDASRGFAVGAYGLMLGTADGGESWEEVYYSDEVEFHLNALVSPAQGVVVVVGEAGTAFRSSDGGQEWEEIDFPYAGSMFGIVGTADGARMITFGLRGRVFSSDDQGQSWEQLDTSADLSLMGGSVLRDGRIVLAGMNGLVLVSSDGGSTFARYRHPDGDALAGAFEAADGRLFVFGESGIAELELSLAAVR